jgi:ketosteroid isomerase-like protein
MAGELGAIVRELFDALDRKDVQAMMPHVAEDAQGVDEISRRWMRGRADLDTYISGLATMVDDVRSELNDLRESAVGDTGVVTCWLEQDYTLEGERHHVSAPTSVVFRRAGEGWEIVLFHSVPLPEGEAA